MSFRDIGAIVDKKEKEKEAKQGQAQQTFASTQAYKLFSEGKSPVQVAIALNLREPEVAQVLCRVLEASATITALVGFMKRLKMTLVIL